MPQILQSKNLATKFRILVEVAANQPTIHQKSIAAKLNLTPQAISDYMMKLEQDGWMVSDGRSKYRVTQEGTNWVLQMLKEISTYADYVQHAITNVSVCAAIADSDLKQGQPVGLQMKDGLLIATTRRNKDARGIAISDAKKGEDVGISSIEGIVELELGQITIAKIPEIGKGGTASTDLPKLKNQISQKPMVGAIGLEALSVLRKLGVTPQYFYGVEGAIVEAAFSGLSTFVVCVDNQIPRLTQRLESENLKYEILDMSIPGNQ